MHDTQDSHFIIFLKLVLGWLSWAISQFITWLSLAQLVQIALLVYTVLQIIALVRREFLAKKLRQSSIPTDHAPLA